MLKESYFDKRLVKKVQSGKIVLQYQKPFAFHSWGILLKVDSENVWYYSAIEIIIENFRMTISKEQYILIAVWFLSEIIAECDNCTV